jgi:YbbR domain-containing protein
MKDFFKRNIFHNLGLKLIALAFAVGLWLVVAREPISEIAVDIPIELQNLPSTLEISSVSIPRAQVRLRGPARVIHQPFDVRVGIDLRDVQPGERTFDLNSQHVHRPRLVEVVQVVPAQVHLVFDTRATRQVEIHPRVVGSFAPGYQIDKVTVDPANLTISGPQKRVQAVLEAITDPIDVSGTMDQNTFVSDAYVADPLVQVIDPHPVHVTVVMRKVTANNGH